MTRFAILMALLLSIVTAQDVPPPPRPTDSGPSLEVTMKFIYEKVTDEGKMIYTASVSDDSKPGAEWHNKFTVEIYNFVADAQACSISFHWRATVNGRESDDSNYTLNLKDVRDIIVLPQEENQRQIDTRNGHPSWISRITPSLFTLVARRPKNLQNAFLFFEKEMSDRVTKAMVHAVELCGGGNKEPF